MKVCVIGLRGLPDVLGGVETHCASVLPLLVQAGCEIDVIVRAPYQPPVRKYEGVRLTPLWCPRHKYLEAITHTFAGVIYARVKFAPDVLHIHAIGPGLATPLARALGMRVVVTHHGADYRRRKWGPAARAALRVGEYLSVRFADRVITVSRSAAESLRERFTRRADRIVFIPNGAGHDENAGSDEPILKRFELAPGGYVLAVGRLVPEKGFDDLIAAHVCAGLEAPLVIAGAADHDDAYSRALWAKGDERVRFLGFQRRDALGVLYRNAALFVLPSYHEGLPIAALEAIAAGAPVLLSDIDAHLELDLPAECYFPVGDRTALAAKLHAPPAGLDARREAILEIYDWARIAWQTHAVYAAAQA